MTALDHHAYAIDARMRAVATVKRVANGMSALFRALLHRREVARLADLSDHGLADIGLQRTDLILASRVPYGVDPTIELRALANERIFAATGTRRIR